MKLRLLVADRFDQLPGNKMLAYGLFTDNRITLHVPPGGPQPTSEIPFALPFSLLACVMEFSGGQFAFEASIQDPLGDIGKIQSSKPGDELKPRSGINLVFHFAAFPVRSIGTYVFRLEVNGVLLQDTFEVLLEADPEAKVEIVRTGQN